MLIQVHEDGSVDFTRNPILEKLFDGEQKIVERMTEIKFDYLRQTYYIQFLRGEFADLVLRWAGAGLERADRLSALWTRFRNRREGAAIVFTKTVDPNEAKGQVEFNSYEDAVAIEVAFIEFLREQGFKFS